MRHPCSAVLVLLATLVAGCSPPETGDASAGRSLAESSPSAPAGPSASVVVWLTLPSGFPVLPGAVAVVPPGADPHLIARWQTDQPGSAAYDYYVVALREAGYPIVGLYPGGGVALIRFREPGGGIWQLIAYGGPGPMTIEVRLDRP